MLVTLGVLFGVTQARAEGFDAQLFVPTEEGGFINTRDSRVLAPMGMGGSFFLHYSHDPLLLYADGKRQHALLGSVVAGQAGYSLGLVERLQASVAVPVNFYASGNIAGSGREFSTTSGGDIRVSAKYQVENRSESPVGFAAVPFVTVPSGNNSRYLGSSSMTGGLVLALDGEGHVAGQPVVWGVNMGTALQRRVELAGAADGSRLLFSAAGETPIAGDVSGLLELNGRTTYGGEFFTESQTPLELDAAVRYRPFNDQRIVVLSGLGRGLTVGLGSPVLRVFSSLALTLGAAAPAATPPPPVTLRGRTVDARTQAPVTAAVFVEPGGIDVAAGKDYFSFVTQPAGVYTLRVMAQGYRPTSVTFSTFPGFTTDVVLRLALADGAVDGTVLDDETGAPVTGAVVTAAPGGRAATLTGGQFSLVLAPGSYVISATAPGFHAASATVAVVAAEAAMLDLRLKVRRAAISGNVRDARNGKPLTADVLLYKKEGFDFVASTGGEFTFSARPATAYTLRFTANGYNTVVTTVTADQASYPMAVSMSPKKIVAAEKKLVLDPIFFATGKALILDESYAIIDSLADYLKEHVDMKVSIEGHTDDKGSAKVNRKLSKKRAEAVRDALTSRGVEKARLKTEGFGPDRPLVANDTEENRAQNRRVEFIIIGGTTR